jgi:hypothetical protein
MLPSEKAWKVYAWTSQLCACAHWQCGAFLSAMSRGHGQASRALDVNAPWTRRVS